MRYTIRTDFERPSAELIARVASTHVGVTGVHAGPRQVMHAAIKPLDPAWRICGPAFTVRPEDPADLLVGEVAGKYARPGDVIVVDGAARIDTACWGFGMSTAAREAGCAGVVLDGLCMNAALLVRERVQLPIFARGCVARAGVAEGPGWLNTPVICGGVIVHPGDIILGDLEGVVVVPRADAERIVAASGGYQGRAAAEAAAGQAYYERRRSEDKLRALAEVEFL